MGNFTEDALDYDFNADKFKTKRIVLYTAVALLTYFGNTLTLVSLRIFGKRFKGTPYVLIGNIAVAGLLLATGLTFQLTEYIFTSLHSNTYFCVVKVCLMSMSMVASGGLLLLMSFDRFCAIVFPMRHLIKSSNRNQRTLNIALAWINSVLVGCIPTIVQASSSKINNTCAYFELTPRVISLIAAIFIPLQFVVSVVLCLIVAWKLRTSSLSRPKYIKSTMKCGLLLKVYIVFAFCWAPFVVTTFLIETTNQKAKYIVIREHSLIPGLVNSAMNWIIYGLAHRKVRQAFKDVLLCRSARDLNTTNYIQSVSSTTRTNDPNCRQQLLANGKTSALQDESGLTTHNCCILKRKKRKFFSPRS